MRVCSLRPTGGSAGGPAVITADGRVHPVPGDLFETLAAGRAADLEPGGAAPLAPEDVAFDAPYRHPRKILGIGLNYREHAADLGADAPRATPASFLKGDHTVIGPGEDIVIPPGIGRVTAEAELALVVGRECYRVSPEEALDYVFGVTAVLDQTAEAVLMENPRYLTRVKNYPTFFSFGPQVVSLDEALDQVGSLDKLEVATVHNGAVHRAAPVSDMIFSPAELLSFHSHVMPLYPGDLLSCGTPGAVPLADGDEVSCRLGDLMTLTNRVVAG